MMAAGRRWILLGGLAAALVLGLALFGLWWSSRGEDALTVSGTIEAHEILVGSKVGGRVAKVHVREGDHVKPGQALVELERDELEARKGQAAADVAAAEAELTYSEKQLRRFAELFRDGAVAAAEVDNARSRRDADRAKVASLRKGLQAIETQLGETVIAAPAEAVVEVLDLRPGTVVAPNARLATLIEPDLWVRVYVPESQIGRVRLGQPVTVQVDSFRDRRFQGMVEQINRQAEFTPRNVQTPEERVNQMFGVKVRLENREGLLRAGMAADVTIPLLAARSAGARSQPRAPRSAA